VLHSAQGPAFPDSLAGKPVTHLSIAPSTGPADAAALLGALAHVTQPTVSTWGPADAERLVGIHLDPPMAVPSVGTGYWLDSADSAADLLRLAIADDAVLAMIEVRHVANDDDGGDGALVTAPGSYRTHAVGESSSAQERSDVDAALATLHSAAGGSVVGLPPPSFADGQTSTSQSAGSSVLARRDAARRALDPERRIRYARDDSY